MFLTRRYSFFQKLDFFHSIPIRILFFKCPQRIFQRIFDEIPYGEYTLSVNAYGTDEVLYYSAQKQVNVESENTEVSVNLKYVGPQLDDDDKNDETEIIITIKINDEIKDINLFENKEIYITYDDIKENNTIILEAPEGFTFYTWFVNGDIESKTSVVKINAENFNTGKYILILFVCDKDGNYYSQDLYLNFDLER